MKKSILTIALTFLILSAFSQQRIVKHPGYTSYYNTKTLIPDSVIWTITAAHLAMDTVPRQDNFHADSGFKDLRLDYLNSGYQRGHNSPYEDNAYSLLTAFQSFSWINVFGQVANLNTKTWFYLENYCRAKARQYGSCRVKTSWLVVDHKMGRDSVVVPKYDVKELWYNGQYEKYIMPNKDSVILHNYTYYKVKP